MRSKGGQDETTFHTLFVSRLIMTPSKQVETNAQVQLAIQRTELALERTQLAWVRTAFAIISAGLAMEKGLQALHDAKLLAERDWLTGGHYGGVFLSLIATVSLTLTTVRYRAYIQSIGGDLSRHTIANPTVWLSLLVILMGIGVSVGLLFWN